ncbi:hypothetical protein JCM17844_17290 [Iodidimonas gelatinilytica]|uniref:Tetratricopeptide repeat protein n=1 Tax=Iodidimonas gelatinilytica TaxID=1236966 RepID=A0A5A7MPW5_9PROT|nr:tetratricopeptide repeat protein [Iodidimonas gelatinilytica]GEQ98092.1 hypothetical protein JCM17844_17290 [Iodidimonas gelatinilytica]
MQQFFREMRRRNVFRVGGAYLVVAWLIVQVVNTVFPALHFPTWTMGFVTILLILGLPVALVFAWAFELTSDGVRRTTQGQEDAPTGTIGRKLDSLIIVGLLLFLAVLLWDGYLSGNRRSVTAKISPDAETSAPSHAIAVLPFVNMSLEKDQEYFSDGISEELLNRLARYSTLRVAARTSSFQFKGQKLDVIEIAEQLNVDHVLEGSVRRSGERLRISAQLIEAESGFQLWGDSYDRDLTDVFAIQAEIADAIVGALTIPLKLQQNTRDFASVNPDAYDAYLKGRDLIHRRTPASIQSANHILAQALAMAPDYAPAHAQLAISYLLSTADNYGTLSDVDAVIVAEPHIKRALSLDEGLADAHAAMGLLRYQQGNPNEALIHLEKATSLNPSHIDALNWIHLALTTVRPPRYGEAGAALRKLLAIDALSPVANFNYALFLAETGQLEEVDKIIRRLANIDPAIAHFIAARNAIIYDRGGPVVAMEEIFQSLELQSGSGQSRILGAQILAGLGFPNEALRLAPQAAGIVRTFEGDYAAAVSIAKIAAEKQSENPIVLFNLAEALFYAGELDEAQSIFETVVHARISSRTGFTSPFTSLAFIRQQKGDLGGAREMLALGWADIEAERSAGFRGWLMDIRAARINAVEGNVDAALVALSQAVENKLPLVYIFDDPVFADFTGNMRFLELKAEVSAYLASERQTLLYRICGSEPLFGDWAPLPETCSVFASESH